MLVLGSLLLTLLVFASGWLWLTNRAALTRTDALLYAGLLGAAQIVGSQLLLGHFGVLRAAPLAALNGLVAAASIYAAVRHRHGRPAGNPPPAPAWGEVVSPSVLALSAQAVLAVVWLLTAAWLLPPRGVDDLVYHLPAIYEFAQSERISVLPLELRTQFALPLGGDFLYLWPLVLTGSTTFVDGVQMLVAIFGVAVVAGLARALDASRADALYAGLVFLLVPVVLAQSASNYVEVILAVSQLLLLYAAVRFWQTGAWLHLVLAGVAAGFGLGVKYSMLVPVLAAQPLLMVRLWRDGGIERLARGLGLFALASLAMGGYWYLRNWLVLGSPLFPYVLTSAGLRDAVPSRPPGAGPDLDPDSSSAWFAVFTYPRQLLEHLFQDPGLGSLNGGLGLAFWMLGLPALVLALGWAVRALWQQRDWLPLFVWTQWLPVTFVFLVQTEVLRLRFNLRLQIFVVALGLVALAVWLTRLRTAAPFAGSALRSAGVAGALLAVVGLANVSLPTLQIGPAAMDRKRGSVTTPFRYFRQVRGDMADLAPAFDLVDYLTRDGAGWTVYLSAEWRVFNTAPLYGSRLQNRVWNFQRGALVLPDAAIRQQPVPGGLSHDLWPEQRDTLSRIARDPAYESVPLPGTARLWIRRALLDAPGQRARLAAWRERTGDPP